MTDTFHRLQTALAERYRLVRELGRGGMATVYLVHDLAHDRPAALKVLHPDLGASLGGERFLREIALGRALQHPNIMGMYDSGEADGLLYYVMPFVDGESLRDRLVRERQLPLEAAVAIARQAADALAYAHAQGVVHRDIKPENILLTRTDDGTEHVVVADFGVARAVTVAGGETLTKTGMAVGTVVYMSPEQAAGSRDVTPASDQYSLACVVYEMLAGQPPFTGPTATAIMARHALDAVPGLAIQRPTVPPEMEEAVLCALHKVPADRFPSITAFATALTTPGATPRRRSAMLPGTGTVELRARLTPAQRRRRAALALVAAVPLAAAAWAGYRHLSRGDIPVSTDARARQVAVLYLEDRSADHSLATFADGLTEDLIGELRTVPTLSVISANGVAPFRHAAVAPDSIARALQVGTVVAGGVAREGDRLAVELHLVDGATGQRFGGDRITLPAGDPAAARDTLAQRAAALIRRRIGQEVQLRHLREGTRSAAAWSLVRDAAALRQRAESLASAQDTVAFPATFARADSLLARAEAADPRWPTPSIDRAAIAYRRSRLALDPLAVARWVDSGLVRIDRALRLAPQSPDALALRGTLRYWRWLQHLEPDPVRAQALFTDARTDLEQATRADESQAEAWAALAHLYTQTDSGAEASAEAARQAYRADAYLANAATILWRLFSSSYDLKQLPAAKSWCETGRRRFPANPRFAECRLLLMMTRAEPADVPRAWRLVDTLVALSPESQRPFQRQNGLAMTASVVARAAVEAPDPATRARLADSARAVIRRAVADPDADPGLELPFVAAAAAVTLDDADEAFRLLRRYVAASPDRRATFRDEVPWWFQKLQDDPRMRALAGN